MICKMTVALKQQSVPHVNILSLAVLCEKLPKFARWLAINDSLAEKIAASPGWEGRLKLI